MNQDIDFVVLWVDGDDPAWLLEKERYTSQNMTDSNTPNRFRDWGLMKYWFRGVEKFAPWVRKIHFVTWGHLPDFLDTEHPKLHIVRHKDFMPPNTLPCFNSCALEINIHHIKGLSEQFVYFNDDMFLVNTVSPETFFVDGMPCLHYAELPFASGGQSEIWTHNCLNDMGIINEFFDKREQIRCYKRKYHSLKYGFKDVLRTKLMELLLPNNFSAFKNFHCPAPFLKHTFWDVSQKIVELYENTSKHRFRDSNDINQWLILWWQLAEGKFVPRKNKSRHISVKKNCQDIRDIIFDSKVEMVCLNDCTPNDEFTYMKQFIISIMETLLPDRSSYEKNKI